MNSQTQSAQPLKLEVQQLIQRKIMDGCFMCRWIHQSLSNDGHLQNWPLEEGTGPLFPVAGQIYHLKQELK